MTIKAHKTAGASLFLEGLTKDFGEVLAVDHIDLQIESGEFVTLLGPSGSGKTTTLLMVAGFELPTEGQIRLDDEPITHQPPYRRDVGLVFQHYALFPHMTVHKNIAFPLEMRKVPKPDINRRVNDALEIVRLPGYGDRYPRQLSGGQQQRIALARSIVFNPQLLLMDEPLGALDKKLREELQLEIKHIQEDLGITVVYVTHDQEEALTMSDRIAVMNRGRIEQVGSATELYERPANHFVADFIGEANFFEATVIAVEGDMCVGRTRNQRSFICPLLSEMKVGDEFSFAIRPERPVFKSPEQEMPNVIRGIIDDVIYVGGLTKYKVMAEENLTFFIEESSRAGGPRHRRGERVEIGWNAEDVITLPD
jgi:putative spermidine/putrescine transport system ATP-binding protein